jgi:hypothetical protein
VQEDRADHIDLNFGCPVPKVTRKGGGSALPWKRDLFRAIVAAVVAEGARRDIPVTVKMRIGIDDDPPHLTSTRGSPPSRRALPPSRCTPAPPPSTTPGMPCGRRSPPSSRRSPPSRCWATETSGRPTTPVRMVAETGCDGVVVGRGCLGRPWLFADLAAALRGVDAASAADPRRSG